MIPLLVVALAGAAPIGRTGVVSSTASRRAPPSSSYGWPVKPFFEQHAVRGLFGDPRIGPGSSGRIEHNLHFGVDVVAANGTPVYATLSGTIAIHPLHHDAVTISDGRGRSFEYWHVVPAKTSGRAIAYTTVVGYVQHPWAHVHFSERVGSRYVNPLRPGAMGPYGDVDGPRIVETRFEQLGLDAGRALSGKVDVVVEAFDVPVLRVPEPWNDIRLTPALVRWRVVGSHAATNPPWCSAFDARGALPTGAFSAVYAGGTRQNRSARTGRYRFYLAHGWNTAALADGSYVLEVSALDIRGNEAISLVPFSTANY